MKRTAVQGPPTPRPPGVVPYVTAWSAEWPLYPPPVTGRSGGRGIAYVDEHSIDRDEEGVLWTRAMYRPGQGRPEFGNVHPLRQRRAMQRMLCQICGGPADRNGQGVLWLLADHRGDWPGWPETMAATHPPVCLPCAAESTRACPHLRRGFVTVRVREPRISGVYGARYYPPNPFIGPVEDVVKAYGDHGIRWVIASQLAMELRGCTFVDLTAELAAAGRRNR
ncbi:hypothetical protein [Streptomyces sp. GMY02]|uniref:hypothetical protein n=1 Tax=Streptomyces sp. GMY02 TaxID=1333528 RepID=UPI0020B74E9B|nr:hypothetical protein [Streptomyces sp. GMY02]